MAAGFLTGAFFVVAVFAGAFFVAAFLVGAFLGVAFLTGAFFVAAASFLAGAFLVRVEVFFFSVLMVSVLVAAVDLLVVFGAAFFVDVFFFAEVFLTGAFFAGALRVRLAFVSGLSLTSVLVASVLDVAAGLRVGALRRVVDRDLRVSVSTVSETSATSLAATSSVLTSLGRLGARRRRLRLGASPSAVFSSGLVLSLVSVLLLFLLGAFRRPCVGLSCCSDVSLTSASALAVSSDVDSSLLDLSSRRPRLRPPLRPLRERRRLDLRVSSSASSSEFDVSSVSTSSSSFFAFVFLGLRFAASRSFLKSRSILTSGSARLSSRFSMTSSSKCGRINSSFPTTSVKTSATSSTCVRRSRFSFKR